MGPFYNISLSKHQSTQEAKIKHLVSQNTEISLVNILLYILLDFFLGMHIKACILYEWGIIHNCSVTPI